MREGTGADRQIARGQRTRDLKAVIDHIVSEIPRFKYEKPGSPPDLDL